MFFFFFKQKTAYEMRISDWSSDVCSSDLHRLDPIVGNEDVVDDKILAAGSLQGRGVPCVDDLIVAARNCEQSMQTLPFGARQLAAQQQPDCVISPAGPNIPPRKEVAPPDRCHLPHTRNSNNENHTRSSAQAFLLPERVLLGY